jgi:tetratricopeptide (TPR) repeat protein
MDDKSAIAWRLPIIDAGREDEGCSYVPRLFRNAPALFYVGRVHEQVFSSLEVRRRQWGLENRLGDAALRHHGYVSAVVRDRHKAERNLRLLQKAVEELPDEPNLLMNYGLELARSDRREEGLVQYSKAFHIMSGQADSLVVPELRETLLTQYAAQLTALKLWDQIVCVLESPLARNGGLTASLHFALGLAHLELKRSGEAADQMRQCLAQRDRPALAPINTAIRGAGPRHCLAICLAQLGQTEEAAEQFRLAVQDDPQSHPARADYARFLAAHGQPVQALNLFYALAKEEKDNPQVWLQGGFLALSQPQFLNVALDWTAVASQRLPEDPAVSRLRAEALLLSGDCAAALPFWRNAPVPPGQLGHERSLAALLLCETVAGHPLSSPPTPSETPVSREFLLWYQRLVQFNARPTLETLNGRIPVLKSVLPSAAGRLAAALASASATRPA